MTAPDLQIIDMDTDSVSQAEIIVFNVMAGDEYILPSGSNQGITLTQQQNGISRIITYSGEQDINIYEDILRSIQFFNSVDEPQPGFRKVSMQVFTPSDGEGDLLPSNIASITIKVLPLNDNPPVFSPEIYNGIVVENMPAGTPVGVVVSASDADTYGTTNITYFIDLENPFITVDPISGVLTTLQPLDAEDGAVFAIINATDNDARPTPLTTSLLALVTIEVSDVNDNTPIFSEINYEVTVPENQITGTVVLSTTATDVDISAQNSAFSYQIQDFEVSSSGSGMEMTVTPMKDLPFAIDPSTGNVTLTSSLDAEVTTRYSFEVIAIDTGIPPLTGTASVVINVENQNDNSPQFSAPQYVASILENATIATEVLSVSASDSDIENSNIMYSLMGTEHFSVDSSSGVISLILTLDFETESSYEFTVIATDQGVPQRTGMATVVISVINVNDNSPQFNPVFYSFVVLENSQFEEEVFASDADGDSVVFSLEDDTFEIDGSTIRSREGVVLDFENVTFYSLTVFGTDGQLTSSAMVEISLLDENDNDPIFEQEMYEAEISELSVVGSIVTRVIATDEDSGSNGEIHYSISSGNDDGIFAIGARSGVISLERLVDFDALAPANFMLVVMAANTAPPALFDTTTVVISIRDENDLPPMLSIDNANVVFIENSPPILFAAGIVVMDSDSDVHQLVQCSARLTYSPCFETSCNEEITVNSSLASNHGLQAIAEPNFIQIIGNAVEGVYMEVLSSLSYSNSDNEPAPGRRQVQINCSDEQFPSMTLNISITVELVNEFCPLLVATTTTLTYTEGESMFLLGQEAGLSLIDDDSAPHKTLEGLTITLSNQLDEDFETISISAPSAITVTDSNEGSGESLLIDDYVITLTGPAVISDFVTALQSLSYYNSQPEPTLGERSVTLLPIDSTPDCTSLQLTLIILPVNDNPPDISLTVSNTVLYHEGSGRVNFAEEAGLIISDADHNEVFLLQSCTVTLSGVLNTGMEILEFEENLVPERVNVTTAGKCVDNVCMLCLFI